MTGHLPSIDCVDASAVLHAPASDKATSNHVPGEIGIWIFILGDMTLYALLFGSFMIDRREAMELYNQSAGNLHAEIALANTVLLLTSSLFVALGVRGLRERVAVQLSPYLFAGALMCAVGFCADKVFEYSDLVQRGYTPTLNTFYMYYYILTGIHLTHVVAGSLVLVYLWRAAARGRFETQSDATYIRGIENGASFWHAVDLLWVALFPMLYLVR